MRGDGGRATDGEARSDEQRAGRGHAEQPAQQAGAGKGHGYGHQDDGEAGEPQVQKLRQSKLQAEQDDGDAQQPVRGQVRPGVQDWRVQAQVHRKSAQDDRDGRGVQRRHQVRDPEGHHCSGGDERQPGQRAEPVPAGAPRAAAAGGVYSVLPRCSHAGLLDVDPAWLRAAPSGRALVCLHPSTTLMGGHRFG